MKSLLKQCSHGFYYAWCGLREAVKQEYAFRIEVIALFAVVPLACYLGKTPWERAGLIIVWLVVMIAEMLNSAVESAVDRIGLEFHPLSKLAKDYGSAAVFIALCATALLWSIALWEWWFS